jgi:hypothetical protein
VNVPLLTVGYASLRIAYAVALLTAPARTARPWLGDAAGEAGGTIAVRGLGVRDLALSAGALVTAASGRSARPWLAACAASDAVDLAATLAADGDGLPSKSKPGTALAAGAFGALGTALAVKHP